MSGSLRFFNIAPVGKGVKVQKEEKSQNAVCLVYTLLVRHIVKFTVTFSLVKRDLF